MAQELTGTNLEKGKGEDEFLEVENLIKETLAESKILEKKAAPPPPPPPVKKDDFSGTKISGPQQEKPAAAAEAPKPKAEASSYEATFKEYKVGDIVTGTVIKVDQSGVLVDIKYKADGLIAPEELSDKSFSSPEEIVKVGDIIKVYIENLESKDGNIVLSKKRAEYETLWQEAYNAFRKKTVLEGRVLQALKGGLAIDCHGIRGFVPASQVRRSGSEPLESFKDQVLPVKIIEINRRQGKIVMSHKLAAGEKSQQQVNKLFDEIEVGQVRSGTVSSLKSFGAFVDLGGVEGLIHLSELSWKRVKHPSEVLKVGQATDVFVLGVDKINRKVALGLKELQPDPWAEATEHFKVGQIVKAKVLRFASFGAFAELEHGLEGLIHISEMSKSQVNNPADAARIGEVVEVKVLRVLPEEQRIGLSIREVLIQKEKEELKKSAPPAQENKVTIADMIAQKEKDRAEDEEEDELPTET